MAPSNSALWFKFAPMGCKRVIFLRALARVPEYTSRRVLES